MGLFGGHGHSHGHGHGHTAVAVAIDDGSDSDTAASDKLHTQHVHKPLTKRLSTVPRLLSIAKPEAFFLVIGVVALIISALINTIVPLSIGLLIDDIGGERDAAFGEQLLWLLPLVFAFGAVTTFVRGYAFAFAGERLVRRLRCLLFERMMSQDVTFFDKNRTGDLLNRLSADTAIIQIACTITVGFMLRFGIQIVGGIVILFYLSWELTLVMLSPLPIMGLIAVVFGKFVRKLQAKVQTSLGYTTTIAEETISSIRFVRAFGMEDKEISRYNDAVNISYRLGKRMAVALGFYQGGVEFIAYTAVMLVIGYGVTLARNGEIDFGEITAFLLYTIYVSHAFGAFSAQAGEFMRAVGASERVFEVIDTEPTMQIEGGGTIAKPKGVLKFESVSFAYAVRARKAKSPTANKRSGGGGVKTKRNNKRDDVEANAATEQKEDESAKNYALRGISFTLKPGKFIGVVGESGAGKSTIASLLMRLYDCESGRITFDGVDIKTLDARWLRSQIGYVQQEPLLFATSIEENIRYGKQDATKEEIIEAAKTANAHKFIMQLSQGYETEVGERGVRLSGGQKQRIAIARALVKKPKLLVFDEATSALDSHSEELVQKSLQKVHKDYAILCISHRLSTVQDADEILVLSSTAAAAEAAASADGGEPSKSQKQRLKKSKSCKTATAADKKGNDAIDFGQCGRIVERGTHDELSMKEGSIYKKLVELQMNNNNTNNNNNNNNNIRKRRRAAKRVQKDNL